ncbi:MAG TPA: alpha/beta hydrolase [Streptosporangiaceae bacterium]|jgi:pimeloyl-ACP methyl ester carboxylesterase
MDTRTGTLDVPGATLYYEARGTGPVLLMIPGGSGDLAPYATVAAALADRRTVVAYERRGFSRSTLDRPLTPDDDATRVATDADDAARLLAHLADAPADVFGSSSGAVVALDLMARHPETVRLLLPHEAPVLTLLPDRDDLAKMLDGVYGTYLASGVGPAMAEFGAAVFGHAGSPAPGGGAGGGAPSPEMAEMAARVQVNLPFWMEHELRTYPRYPVDADALRAVADRIVPLCGHDSRGQFPYRANAAVADLLARPVTETPGGHVGYITHPDTFPPALAEALAGA